MENVSNQSNNDVNVKFEIIPDVLVEPEVIQTLDVLVEPEVIQTLDVFVEPEVTQNVDVLVEPEVTQTLDVLAEPEVTQNVDVLVALDVLVEPEVTQNVDVLVEPEVIQTLDVLVEPEVIQNLEIVVKQPKEVSSPTLNQVVAVTPTLIFIVPYRDRNAEYLKFDQQMKSILAASPKYANSYKILYIHQCDTKPFNRGALKNIGFQVIKSIYPLNYKKITLVFNDVDTYPTNNTVIPDYTTTYGILKHFYGFTYALGGIVSITARDFELLNGFPNFWSWGYEDNLLQKRANKYGMVIDRSVFYPITDNRIVHSNFDFNRTVNRDDFSRYMIQTKEGISNVTNVHYKIANEFEFSTFINVANFETGHIHNVAFDQIHDIRNGNKPFITGYSSKRKATMNMVVL